MKKSLFHIIFGCLVIVLFFGCSSSDEKANKLFVNATQLVKSAQEAEVKSYSDALKFYKDALEKTEEIISKYPSSQVAVRLSQKKVDSGPYTITDFRHFVANTKLKADAEEDPLACAFFVANTIKDTGKKAWALLDIASFYAKAGQYDKALHVAKTIEKDNYKANAFSWIADSYAEAGQNDKALKMLSQALHIAKTIKDDYLKTLSWRRIADSYAKAGQYDKALKMLSQALHITETMKNTRNKNIGLSLIAKSYAKAGQYDKALQVVKTIEEHGCKADALSSIADSYAEAGKHDKALEILPQAFKNAGDSPWRLCYIAETYAKAGQKDKASEILSQIFQKKKNLEGMEKIWGLAGIGASYAKVGGKIDDKGRKILHEIIREIDQKKSVI